MGFATVAAVTAFGGVADSASDATSNSIHRTWNRIRYRSFLPFEGIGRISVVDTRSATTRCAPPADHGQTKSTGTYSPFLERAQFSGAPPKPNSMSRRRLLRRQLYILVRGRVGVARNQPKAGLGHAGAVPVEEAQLPDRREHGLVVHELLELVEDHLAALGVQLGRLLAEEAFDVRVTAIAVEAVGRHEGLDPSRGVASGSAPALDEVSELLVLELAEERRPLERTHLRGDPDHAEVVHDGLDHRCVGVVDRIFPGVEAIGVAGLGEELLRLRRIVRPERWLPGELEAVRNDARGDPREAERLRLVDGLAIDRVVRRHAHALVGPRRLRVPLIDEVHPLRAVEDRRFQREPGRPPQLLSERPADGIDDVGLAALQHGQPR